MSMLIPLSRPSRSMSRNGYGQRGLFDFFPSSFAGGILDELANVYGQTGIEVDSSSEATVYSFNLAGFEENEISVKADPKAHMLYIEAAHKDDTRQASKSYQYPLPEEMISPEMITKSYRNGLLTITVKKPETSQNEAFEVQSIGNSASQASITDSSGTGDSQQASSSENTT